MQDLRPPARKIGQCLADMTIPGQQLLRLHPVTKHRFCWTLLWIRVWFLRFLVPILSILWMPMIKHGLKITIISSSQANHPNHPSPGFGRLPAGKTSGAAAFCAPFCESLSELTTQRLGWRCRDDPSKVSTNQIWKTLVDSCFRKGFRNDRFSRIIQPKDRLKTWQVAAAKKTKHANTQFFVFSQGL